jgi:hypothetical protein
MGLAPSSRGERIDNIHVLEPGLKLHRWRLIVIFRHRASAMTIIAWHCLFFVITLVAVLPFERHHVSPHRSYW